MNQVKCTMTRGRNCYHAVAGKRNCWDCSRNENHNDTELTDNYISIVDKVTVLCDYLAGGDMAEGVVCWQPKMSRKHAFSVIWFMQEIIHCLPDHIEACRSCGDLFDTDCEGYHLDDQYDLKGKTLPKKYWGCWCDNCVPDVEFVLG